MSTLDDVTGRAGVVVRDALRRCETTEGSPAERLPGLLDAIDEGSRLRRRLDALGTRRADRDQPDRRRLPAHGSASAGRGLDGRPQARLAVTSTDRGAGQGGAQRRTRRRTKRGDRPASRPAPPGHGDRRHADRPRVVEYARIATRRRNTPPRHGVARRRRRTARRLAGISGRPLLQTRKGP